jgi:hypothetical protein
MFGLELAVVALALLSCLSLAGVAVLLVQVRALRRTPSPEPSPEPSPGPSPEPSPEPSGKPSREVRTVRSPVERDASVRVLPSAVTETSRSRELAHPAEPAPVQPLVRVVAVAHGVRCALASENRDRIRALVRRDIRRRHKLRLRAARRAARVLPIDAEPREETRVRGR